MNWWWSLEDLFKVFLISRAGVNDAGFCSPPIILSPTTNVTYKDNYIDLFYISQGSVEMIFNNFPKRKLVVGEIIILHRKKNDCFILSGSTDTVIIHIKISSCGIYQDLIMCHSQQKNLKIINKDNAKISKIAAEMTKLMAALKNKNMQKSIALEKSVALFFIQLYLMESEKYTFQYQSIEKELSKLMLDIIKKPGYLWCVNKMASKHNMSTNAFINEFRKLSGYTPFYFLKKIRLNRGRLFLENTELPISTIASKCGYNSHASFTLYIRKEFGKSPLQLRQEARSKKTNNKTF